MERAPSFMKADPLGSGYAPDIGTQLRPMSANSGVLVFVSVSSGSQPFKVGFSWETKGKPTMCCVASF